MNAMIGWLIGGALFLTIFVLDMRFLTGRWPWSKP